MVAKGKGGANKKEKISLALIWKQRYLLMMSLPFANAVIFKQTGQKIHIKKIIYL